MGLWDNRMLEGYPVKNENQKVCEVGRILAVFGTIARITEFVIDQFVS